MSAWERANGSPATRILKRRPALIAWWRRCRTTERDPWLDSNDDDQLKITRGPRMSLWGSPRTGDTSPEARDHNNASPRNQQAGPLSLFPAINYRHHNRDRTSWGHSWRPPRGT